MDTLYYSVDLEAIDRTARNLMGAFVWSDSVEGHDYWNDVYNKLRDIEYEVRKRRGTVR